MPFVSIVQAKRDPQTTRRLVRAITDSFADICGVGPDRVSIHLQDVDGEHWAEAGVLLADRARKRAAAHEPTHPEGAAMLETFTDISAMRRVNARFGLKNTPVIRAGDLYFCSGLTALDLETGDVVEGDVREHARVVLDDVAKILAEVGLGLDNVVKIGAFLADPVNDFKAWNEVYLETFAEPYPCRTTVGAQLHVGLIELDVVASRFPRR